MTDTAKHTPGPWSYDGEDIGIEAAHLVAEEAGLTHDGYEVFSVDADGDVDMPIGTALNEEDARLIAAAPDMAEALKKLSFMAQTSGGTAGRDEDLVKAIEQAHVALAKAGLA